MTAPVLLVMAGGRGARLWPRTHAERPKPLVVLPATRRSLLARTIATWQPIVRGELRISCARGAAGALAREAGVSRRAVLVDPAARGTAASMLYAASKLAARDRVLVMVACDGVHGDARRLASAVHLGIAIARAHDVIVSPGAPIDRPTSDYGYMECLADASLPVGAFRCGRFVEKPAPRRAAALLASGQWCFHTGVVIARASVIRAALERHARRALAPLLDVAARDRRAVADAYAACGAISFDEALFERCTSEHAVVSTGTSFVDVGRDFEALLSHAKPAPRIVARVRDEASRLRGGDLVVSSRDGDVLVCGPSASRSRKHDQEILLESRAPRTSGLRRLVLSGVSMHACTIGARSVTIEARSVARTASPTVVVATRAETADRDAAAWLVSNLRDVLAAHGRADLVLSAGRSPKGLCAAVARDHARALDWTKVRVVQMDELVRSDGRAVPVFAKMLRDRFVTPLGITRVDWLESLGDVHRIEARLAHQPSAVVAVHGIGVNGHLALNEPGARASGLRTLADETVRALRASRLWRDPEPPRGLTLGASSFARIDRSLLLAFGTRKHDALSRLLFTRDAMPARVLERCASWWVICDVAAWSGA